MRDIIVKAQGLLQGEPLRFIVYGSAIVVWLVVGIANALGLSQLGPTLSLNNALVWASVAAGALTEIGRRYVSPVAGLTPPEPTTATPVPTGSEPA